MPRGVKKENLPSKVCVTCNRPFTWRKKWEACWDEVTTCSKKCNGERRRELRRENRDTKKSVVEQGDALNAGGTGENQTAKQHWEKVSL
jgi:hypothetical protein